ncbi:MAG: prefoldin subunit alpha [Fervidicoccaceae archaeon]
MSEKVQIDANALVQTIDRLEKYIEGLKEVIEDLNERLIETRTAAEGIKRIQQGEIGEVLISIDRYGNSLIRLKGKVEDKALVHLGLGIYVENSFGEAIRLLEQREQEIKGEIERVSKELEYRTREYQRLQSLIYSLAAQGR